MGLAAPALCQELGISTATFEEWRAKYGGMGTSMWARLKELVENARLNKMYDDKRLKTDTHRFVDESKFITGVMNLLGSAESFFMVKILIKLIHLQI